MAVWTEPSATCLLCSIVATVGCPCFAANRTDGEGLLTPHSASCFPSVADRSWLLTLSVAAVCLHGPPRTVSDWIGCCVLGLAGLLVSSLRIYRLPPLLSAACSTAIGLRQHSSPPPSSRLGCSYSFLDSVPEGSWGRSSPCQDNSTEDGGL